MYNENDLSGEAWYQKGRLVKFINNLGYIEGVTPMEEVDKKQLNRLIGVQLLIRARSWEERRTIFGKL